MPDEPQAPATDAEPDTQTPDTPLEAAPAEPPEDTDEKLGDNGVKALERWKQRAKEAEKTAKRATELEQQLEKLRRQSMSEQERAIAQARDEARAETVREMRKEMFSTRAVAAATGKLINPELVADPDVALKLLGLDDIPVTDTGAIDTETINAAVSALLERHSYLAATATAAPATGSADQGARATAPTPPTMNDLIRAARS